MKIYIICRLAGLLRKSINQRPLIFASMLPISASLGAVGTGGIATIFFLTKFG